jgi:hypothetical protein
MNTYQMKDLGYERTPTDARYQITMSNGDVYSIPLQLIADSRDEYYKEDEEDTIGFILDGGLDEYDLKDWASGNMNWEDVRDYACLIGRGEIFPDFQDGWVNGKSDIAGLKC